MNQFDTIKISPEELGVPTTDPTKDGDRVPDIIKIWQDELEQDITNEIHLLDNELDITLKEESPELVKIIFGLIQVGQIEEAQKQLDSIDMSRNDYREKLMSLQSRQVDDIEQLYKRLDDDYRTPIEYDGCHRQQNINGSNTCVLASIRNAVEALAQLGNKIVVTSEEDLYNYIIEKYGEKVFDSETGNLDLITCSVTELVEQFYRKKAVKSGNLFSLLNTLEKGGVAIIVNGNHARLISSFSVKNSSINFKVHDPLAPEDEANYQLLTLRNIANDVVPSEWWSNMILIEDDNQVTDEDIKRD